uniref:Mucin-5ac n=1 Tax=Anisakis simplex TaxID=6269 RepID=A0A0M3JQK0_ANISI
LRLQSTRQTALASRRVAEPGTADSGALGSRSSQPTPAATSSATTDSARPPGRSMAAAARPVLTSSSSSAAATSTSCEMNDSEIEMTTVLPSGKLPTETVGKQPTSPERKQAESAMEIADDDAEEEQQTVGIESPPDTLRDQDRTPTPAEAMKPLEEVSGAT